MTPRIQVLGGSEVVKRGLGALKLDAWKALEEVVLAEVRLNRQ